jgi:endonuclease-8|tara:strand:- start:145 stop:921 length:777 start_codon:yes stop_codon:yes gene_type:complete
MPEGHTIHRAAHDHRKLFVGFNIAVSSPQGRFNIGAKSINKQQCVAVEAFGKHLLYEFKNNQSLHIHLGLFGRIKRRKLPDEEVKGEVRVRLVGKTHLIDINGPTICEILNEQAKRKLIGRIGPDLLRKDADPIKFFERISRSRAKIGTLLMDQSVVAGIGNIYRTELLWRQCVHPNKRGQELDRSQLENLWNDARALLEVGVKHNKIITNFQKAGSVNTDNLNIYKKKECPRCQGDISKIDISGRKAYFCDFCQSDS